MVFTWVMLRQLHALPSSCEELMEMESGKFELSCCACVCLLFVFHQKLLTPSFVVKDYEEVGIETAEGEGSACLNCGFSMLHQRWGDGIGSSLQHGSSQCLGACAVSMIFARLNS